MLNAKTKENLKRKSAYVDNVQLHDGVVLPSWIDLSLSELCNRSGPASKAHKACVFCPRIDPTFYPNQNINMSMGLVEKIANELVELKYIGVVVLCGYGEPLLHPNVVDIVKILKQAPCRLEIVTNGDYLGPVKIGQLLDAGTDYFVVSMYDGPHQVEIITKNFMDAGRMDCFLLRDRWHSGADQFGLKLTNRGGTVVVGAQDEVDVRHPCYYTAYQMQIDWNGDVLLCPQDWVKKLKFGNVSNESLLSIWTSKRLHKRRMQLIDGRRVEHPCSECNTDGTLHGENHVVAWGKK